MLTGKKLAHLALRTDPPAEYIISKIQDWKAKVRVKKKNRFVKIFTIDYNVNENKNASRLVFLSNDNRSTSTIPTSLGSFVKNKVFVYSFVKFLWNPSFLIRTVFLIKCESALSTHKILL